MHQHSAMAAAAAAAAVVQQYCPQLPIAVQRSGKRPCSHFLVNCDSFNVAVITDR